MFQQYFVYYDGRFAGTVMALSESSAKDKGAQLVGAPTPSLWQFAQVVTIAVSIYTLQPADTGNSVSIFGWIANCLIRECPRCQ